MTFPSGDFSAISGAIVPIDKPPCCSSSGFVEGFTKLYKPNAMAEIAAM